MAITGKVKVNYPILNGFFYNSRIAATRIVNGEAKLYQFIDWADIYNFETGDYEFVCNVGFTSVLIGFANVTARRLAIVDLWLAKILITNCPLDTLNGERQWLEYQHPADKKLEMQDVIGSFTVPTMPPGVTATATKYHVVKSQAVKVSVGTYSKRVRTANISPLMPGAVYTWDLGKSS